MKEYIEKEILRQLQLIKFDRSKTLLEQNVKNKKDVSKQTKTPEFKPIDFKLPMPPHFGEEIDTTLWFGDEKIIVFRNGDKYYADDMTPFPNNEHMKFDPYASKKEEEFYKKNPCLVDSYTDGVGNLISIQIYGKLYSNSSGIAIGKITKNKFKNLKYNLN